MAFFKFRQKGEEPSTPPNAPERIETLRKRARYRLAGAAVLVLTGVIGFPLLFDSQPRPIAVDIPIVIPDKSQAKALVPIPLAVASQVQVQGSVQVEAASAPKASTPVPTVPVAIPVPVPAVDKGTTAKPEAARNAPTPVAKASAPGREAARAQALLDGKALDGSAASGKPAASDSGRFVVQFGSFSDAAKAHEARLKVERAGFKTYAQVAQTPDGKRFRVRVGPFAHRAEADKAAEKIRKLNLSTNILEL